MAASIDKQNVPEEEKNSRGTGWRIAAFFCTFWYALLGWLRFTNGLKFSDNFTDINLWPRPLYISISGLVIGILFTTAIIFMVLKIKYTPAFLRILGVLFILWLWFDHIWFGTREAFFNQVIITLLITLVTLILIFVLVKKKDYNKEKKNDWK